LVSDSRELKSDKEKEDKEENFYSDLEDVDDVNESKIQLKDFFTEQTEGSAKEEKVGIEIPGVEGKTEVKIKYKDSTDDSALKGVTIEFNALSTILDNVHDTYNDVDFKAEEMIEDHENEGQDWVFVAEEDDIEFRVEVQVEASYQESNNIQAIDWGTLEVEFDTETESIDESHCTEQEIAEGTCGYGMDGELGDKPAGPDLIAIFEKVIRNLKK